MATLKERNAARKLAATQPEEEHFDPSIDEMRLDHEWLRQPELYYKWAVLHADAKNKVDEFKNELEVVKASLDISIRESPEDYSLTKVTESTVASAVLTHNQYEYAHRQLLKAKHAADILGAAMGALDNRKKALENLVYLQGQNYFAAPVARGEDARERMGAVEKRDIRRKGIRRERDNGEE